jgi:hypothetical protein
MKNYQITLFFLAMVIIGIVGHFPGDLIFLHIGALGSGWFFAATLEKNK